MELLERVVGRHCPIDFLGDAQQERIPRPMAPSGRMKRTRPPQRSLFETRQLGGIDPVLDTWRRRMTVISAIRMVSPQLGDGFLQLLRLGSDRPRSAMFDHRRRRCARMGMVPCSSHHP